ncbi:MAG TPA: carbonic anhydrase family protein [Terriglobia bacterium]|nr:carbonic anhydrase family protein [Terriglobia bacterium]
MLQRAAACFLCVIVGCLTVLAQHPGAGPEFGYSGAEGPQAWGNLSPAYAACKLGHAQSPIDIRATTKQSLPPIQFHYEDVPLRIVNNGHSIQVNYAPGSWITVGDHRYDLRQFHFHHPSEEHINGKGFDLSLHLVHVDAAGKLAVVAVLLEGGSANEAVRRVFDNLPPTPGQEHGVAGITINARAFLPPALGYYTFEGSLTTPPCTEGVTWFVLKTPDEVSTDEVAAFAKLYPKDARPIQPAEGRKILESEF